MATCEIIGRSGNRFGRVRKYSVRGAESESVAIGELIANLGAELGVNLLLDGFPCNGFNYDETAVSGDYDFTITWGYADRGNEDRFQPATGEFDFRFEVGTQPVRVLTPPAGGAITTYAAPGQPPLTVKLIGETGDPENPAEGVEVFESTYAWEETRYLDAALVTDAYKAVLRTLAGRINIAPWRTFDAQSVLFRGVTGQLRYAIGDFALTFRFSSIPNQTGLAIGDVTGIDKKGYQYLWPISVVKESDGRILRDITHVAVGDVLMLGDFSALGI